MKTWSVLGIVIVLCPIVATAQEPGPGTRHVNPTGKVVDSSGRGIPNVHLHMVCSYKTSFGGTYDAQSEDQGSFTFKGAPDDVCVVTSEDIRIPGGYQNRFNGNESEEPWVIRLAAPQAPTTLSGRVLDDKGKPLASASVYLSRERLSEGHRTQPFLAAQYTDQDGKFSLPLGFSGTDTKDAEAILRICAEWANPSNGSRTAYPLTCFPGVADRNKAERIRLRLGDSRDLPMHLAPVPAGAVSIRVSNPQPDTLVSLIHPDRQDFPYGGVDVYGGSWNLKKDSLEAGGLGPADIRCARPPARQALG